MRQEAINAPGLYLFALPTLALVKEQAKAFRNDDPALDLTEAHSQATGRGSVQSRLDRALARIKADNISHAVILTTHESLMGCDLQGFTGWHARIDEAPNAVQSGKLKVAASKKVMSGVFTLAPFRNGGWAEITPVDQQSFKTIEADAIFKPMAELLKQAKRRHGAYVDTTEWKPEFGWCSLWTPTALSQFASVKIAGASYLKSLGAVVVSRHLSKEIQFNEVRVPMPRTADPDIRIHYFTSGHEGTSTLWESHGGRRFVKQICDFLTTNEPQLGFWSGNEEVQKLMDWRVHGGPIPPKVAGLNAYLNETSCAFIYSSKPLSGDDPVKSLFGLSNAEIIASREEEDVLQFVMRGAIRNPDFGGRFDIYLYSKRQADLLAEQLGAGGFNTVSVEGEDSAGIMDDTVVKSDAPKPLNGNEREERRRESKRLSSRNLRKKKVEAEGRKLRTYKRKNAEEIDPKSS
jgi:hypothetical protein